jgi:alkylated DNA repair dioxygenase AlkB
MTNFSQGDLFTAGRTVPENQAGSLARVAGLIYVPNLLPPAAQTELLRVIDSLPWMKELKRKVQHYGYRYDYRARSVDRSMRLGDLPEWAVAVANLLQERELLSRSPDQLIVNEYEPGQGISKHIDCEPCFDGNIASVSLGSTCVMNFIHKDTGETIPVLLEPGSVAVLTGAARYDWMHAIPARKRDTFGGQVLPRNRRVSLTFRKVILEGSGN